jgi:ferredoxin-type protein NapF
VVDLTKRRIFARQIVDDSSVRLPWLANASTFTDQCTRCGKCVDSCETRIITKGDGGFPTVDFTLDECTFCYQCAEVCPEPLFTAKTEQPWNARATINDDCLAQKKCRMPKLWRYVRHHGNTIQITNRQSCTTEYRA